MVVRLAVELMDRVRDRKGDDLGVCVGVGAPDQHVDQAGELLETGIRGVICLRRPYRGPLGVGDRLRQAATDGIAVVTFAFGVIETVRGVVSTGGRCLRCTTTFPQGLPGVGLTLGIAARMRSSEVPGVSLMASPVPMGRSSGPAHPASRH